VSTCPQGSSSGDFLAQIVGDGNTGSAISTGWHLYSVNLGTLGAGAHTLVIGGYNSRKTEVSETHHDRDRRRPADRGEWRRASAVATLDFARFKENIRILSDFGDRTQGSPSYMAAAAWLEGQLTAAGYKVERHRFTYNGQPRDSIYVTKVGTLFPDQMYIVSAHLDGRRRRGGQRQRLRCSLVLESARGAGRAADGRLCAVRVLEQRGDRTQRQHGLRQPAPDPAGCGESTRLGRVPGAALAGDDPARPDPLRSRPAAPAAADPQRRSRHRVPGVVELRRQSLQLANALRNGNRAYSTDYPAQIGSNMNHTDSVPFQNYTATVSVRDNQRVAEIGNGSNPHWHQPTDVYARSPRPTSVSASTPSR
jgi:hypothetical protein